MKVAYLHGLDANNLGSFIKQKLMIRLKIFFKFFAESSVIKVFYFSTIE